MNRHVIIVAGGSGTRMNATVPKQFLPLAGKPVIMHTIEKFHRFGNDVHIWLVLPAGEQERWKRLVDEHGFTLPLTLVNGGMERFHSVRNALELMGEQEGVVAVHDGVRPLVSATCISAAFEAAHKNGSGIPVIPVNESLRQRINGGTMAVNRADYLQVQTPQCFRINSLIKAYRLPFQSHFTDDASVFEADGNVINLIAGEPGNIKITTPSDLILAKCLLSAGV